MNDHKLKMAMALQGKKKRYSWNQLLYRHWLSTAKHCHFSQQEMDVIIQDTLEKMDSVLEEIMKQLPDNFPAGVVGPIADGMRKSRDRLARSKSPSSVLGEA